MNILLVNKQQADSDPETRWNEMMEQSVAGPPARSGTPAAPRTPAPSAAPWRSSSVSSSRCTCAAPSGARGGHPSRGAHRDPGGQKKISRHQLTLQMWSQWDRATAAGSTQLKSSTAAFPTLEKLAEREFHKMKIICFVKSHEELRSSVQIQRSTEDLGC